jgi:purine-binding chemotaxis protein CheW
MYNESVAIKPDNQRGDKTVIGFLTFNINEHVMGLDMLCIDRIIKLNKICPIPNSYDYLEGLVEIENLLIPVVSLKKLFNFESKGVLPDSNIIVLSYENKKYGIIVDCVNDINEINEENILKTQTSKYMYGAVKFDEAIIKLLNLESLVIH